MVVSLEKIGKSFLKDQTFAFDFDGVVADTMSLFAAIGRDEFGLSDLYPEKITDYDLSRCLDVDMDTLIQIITRVVSADYNHRLGAMPGAKDILNKLAEKSGPLLFVTARPDGESVKCWLKDTLNMGEDICEVIATGSFDAKAEILQSRGKKLFVEDRLETCFHLKEAGIEPVLFVQPWNRRPHSFHEVRGWSDLADFFGV
ncbi:5' nucleotidase, NT5C type [Desulfobotulus mexicanus]|uniref:Haloacid dehalogenase n=1 Tax=Desulfobotulus mexicanus TaxID=2586642 RepID=A0A5S5MD93_9BACT|nr:haloacid dehalogenase [Desulfobotulus mexicanus]TYT73688.1 haloacid dehalogenase [Desulfobotulus mexicanus]